MSPGAFDDTAGTSTLLELMNVWSNKALRAKTDASIWPSDLVCYYFFLSHFRESSSFGIMVKKQDYWGQRLFLKTPYIRSIFFSFCIWF